MNTEVREEGMMAPRHRRILVRTQQKTSDKWKWGFSDKTGWDWLQLLIIPLVLLGIGSWFTYQQNQTSHQIAADQQQEATLEAYLDHMAGLLLDRHLGQSHLGDEVQSVAIAETLTTLRRLDSDRKGVLLRFLYDSGLINRNNVIVDLTGADLSGIRMPSEAIENRSITITDDLSNAFLMGAYLSNADLSGIILSNVALDSADLHNANLSFSILRGASLGEASLIDADLSYTDLSGAYLTLASLQGANLSHAFLKGADLSHANLAGATVTNQQLNEAKSLKGATMPDGSIHP